MNACGGRVRKNLLGVVNVALPRIQAELYFTEKFAESGIEALVWTNQFSYVPRAVLKGYALLALSKSGRKVTLSSARS